MEWRPWGPEAFAEAKRENKPVFLSIGFSTCLWCHVMQRESFTNPAIAALLNRRFVPVLVDREERPDVDRTYMAAAQAAGWSAGWPLNLWLTPDKKPFFGGAYFPPEARGGLPGLRPLLERVAELWRTRRDDAIRDSEDIAKALEDRAHAGKEEAASGTALLDAGFEAYRSAFDSEHGGFGPPPKFPLPSGPSFLLRYAARTGKTEARDMAVRTLRAMAAGEIHDRVGGGFHRYATGAAWSAPHHEKILGDNARLASVYLEAYQATGEKDFARVARETLDYMLRNMSRPGGGFYTAEDADADYYALPSAEARSRRPRPFRDEKILAGVNGLALSALAKGARVLAEPRYLAAAADAERFLRGNLYDAKANRLYRRWRDGERKIPGLPEDYAYAIGGLLDLHEAERNPARLAWAARLAEAPSEADATLPAPEDADAAAVAASNALRLAALTERTEFSRAFDETLKRYAGRMARAPREHAALLCALEASLAQPASGKVK